MLEDLGAIVKRWSAHRRHLSARPPEFADLDGDGEAELISGHIAEQKDKFNWVAEPSLLFWKNRGTPDKPQWEKADFGFPAHLVRLSARRNHPARGGLERGRTA